jgi:hypothetical protein
VTEANAICENVDQTLEKKRKNFANVDLLRFFFTVQRIIEGLGRYHKVILGTSINLIFMA